MGGSTGFVQPAYHTRVAGSRERPSVRSRRDALVMTAAPGKKRVLLIGGSRFSGLYLAKELSDRGHDLVLLNRGSIPVGDERLKVPGETDEAFKERSSRTSVIVADRTNEAELLDKLKGESFDVIYDNNGREMTDSKPLIDMYKGNLEHYVYMSSAGVYMKSDIMPHIEGDAVDPKSRHKGKFETETYLSDTETPYTAIRPTYIYGALNYNPVERFFFERIDAGRPVPVPGHGMHLTGLGHVQDLATAMAAVIGNEKAIGQVYNIQDRSAVTFDGIVRCCAEAMGKDPSSVEIAHFNPKDFDFGKKKAFPMRPQHFFTSPDKALAELDWTIQYETVAGLRDSYENDFLARKASGGLKNDFETDDMILNK